MKKKPVLSAPAAFRVVLTGRPNVGKSALFNRLAGSRKALVHDRPGMTRDFLEENAATASGRVYRLVDTGGLDLDAPGGFPALTREKAFAAVADADLLLFVLDGAAGLLPEDERIARRLRILGKRVVAVWNKADTREANERLPEAAALAFDETVPVSALHGSGIEELEAIIEAAIPEGLEPATELHPLPVAVVGRPNVGKSSLVNAIFGSERVMVSEVAGTTRDSIDVLVERGGQFFNLLDTAGIRRKGKTADSAEILSVVGARKAIDRARVVVAVFDASEGITAQDATIAGYAEAEGRALLLIANKWDIVLENKEYTRRLRENVHERFAFTQGAPFLPVSAKTGFGVSRILPEATALAQRFATRMPTGELNRVLQRAFERQQPKGKSGRDLKIRYAVQVGSEPPRIQLFADREEGLHFSFERFLGNRIREKWALDGVPIRFSVRAS